MQPSLRKKASKRSKDDQEAEFSRLFWAARKQQALRGRKVLAQDSASKAAMEFADAQGWAWAKGLIEASRLSQTGEFDKALKFVAETQSSVPERWQGLLQFVRGSASQGSGQYDEAIKAYREALEDAKLDQPGNTWHNLGNALGAKGDYDVAIKAYQKALDDPNYATPGNTWHNIGNALGAKGDYDEAIKAYQKALDDPNYATPGNTWHNIGNALGAKGDYDEAIKAYQKALDDPNYATPGDTWNNLGIALRDKGEHDEAIKAYRKALDDPNYATPGDTWNNLGIALRDKGEHDEAIKAYRKALDDPNYATPGNTWHNIGNALGDKVEHDEAIKAYRKALDDPNYATPGDTWNNLGNALGVKGEHDEAIKAYQKALDDPNFQMPAKAWTNLAQTYVDAGKLEEAESAYQKALTSTDTQGSDHARARHGLQILRSKIAPAALSSDDRAMMARPATGGDTAEIEEGIIAAINEAGDTQYDRYIKKADSGRDSTLSILRGWSSAVTLLEGSERRWRGGGYFLKWRGYGIVIDPGFDFLRNFHDAGYHGREIAAVVVSHNHPDHNSDLKHIDDLRYELYKRLASTNASGSKPYVLLWDEDTSTATKFGFDEPQHQHPPIVMGSGFPQPLDLGQHPAKIPLRITPFKVNHGTDVQHALGMMVELLDDKGETVLRIGYTADTAYFMDLHQHLSKCDVLIAHISQPSIEELRDASKLKDVHLGYRGTARLLKECKPKLALIGEFWAGFTDLRIPLVKGLRQLSGVKDVLPTGLAMHLRLPSLDIECTECKKPTPFAEVKVAPPTDKFGSLAYLCPGCTLG
ncbi:tetratricopeptide (TPR) repeat protein [Prosthecobacter fusiformis]|uniref:Tetratricopeptide (TPR) repeat protein n=1 Tax=Prosthecobacter fusiformis TaxID=48464 RepID=A0A4R7S0L4_9BACT|nr:tetratricopeptide repeat protein [Prosthecobacter fusiformis]TDU70918.1 tetratricopeptide (TPR) repeat protein [Prosthecobacter fusiformis]